MAGIYQDPDGQHMWLMDRCGGNNCAGVDVDPILKLDLQGNLVTSFGKGTLRVAPRFLRGPRRKPLGDRGIADRRTSRRSGIQTRQGGARSSS